jgi:hypothetical protein
MIAHTLKSSSCEHLVVTTYSPAFVISLHKEMSKLFNHLRSCVAAIPILVSSSSNVDVSPAFSTGGSQLDVCTEAVPMTGASVSESACGEAPIGVSNGLCPSKGARGGAEFEGLEDSRGCRTGNDLRLRPWLSRDTDSASKTRFVLGSKNASFWADGLAP